MLRIIMVSVLVLCLTSIKAQNSEHKVKIYLDGSIVDYDYVRRNIENAEFVNDPNDCDVHVLSTEQTTGSDGIHYRLNFNGKDYTSISDFTIDCIIYSEDTQDTRRTKFTETLKSGIIPFINQLKGNLFPFGNPSVINSKLLNPIPQGDKWDYWVFTIELEGSGAFEEQKKDFAYEVSLEANRVTEDWRFHNKYEYEQSESRIKKIEEYSTREIRNYNKGQNFESFIVYSLSDHWSTGLFSEAEQFTYKNTKYSLESCLALEYNFFPWDEADRRNFRLAAAFGPNALRYYEETILGKTYDMYWKGYLRAETEYIENWGNIYFMLEYGYYFPTTKYYYLKSGCDLSVRLTKGFFVDFSLEASKINNQFYLPASELTDEELLLNARKLPTTYEITYSIGFKFQFGSIYNSIVNERLR